MTIDREKVLQAAQAFIQRKRYDRAVAEYRKLIQQDPEDARILLKIGDLQSKMEAHADAIATYERVGRQYARQGFALKAIAVYKQIREIIRKHVPDLADRYNHIIPLLAELYTQLGLVSDAVGAYDEMAMQLLRAGQDVEAINILQKVITLDGQNPLPHLKIAEAYSRIHDTEGAILHFGSAAKILVDLGRSDDALKVLERLLHHKPDPTFARKAAEMYLARGNANDGMLALAKLQVCFQANPKDLDTLGLLARAFVMIDQPAKAIEVYKELARIARDQGKFDLFKHAVETLVRAAPTDETVRRLAASLADGGQRSPVSEMPIPLSDSEIEEVADVRDQARSSMPSEIPLVQVQNTGRRGQPEPPAPYRAATAAQEQAKDARTALSPEEEAALTQRILTETERFCLAGLQGKAIDHLEKAIGQHRDSVILRRRLRDILYELGEYNRTADEMVRIAQVFIDQHAPEYAAEELQAIFTFLADHPQARRILVELGYAVPADDDHMPAEQAAQQAQSAAPPAVQPEAPRAGSMAPGGLDATATAYESAPPSVRVDTHLSSGAPAASPAFASPGPAEAMLDQAGARMPLPAFPMEEEAPANKGMLAETERVEAQPLAPETGAGAQPADSQAEAPRAATGATPTESIEDALEEAEFFMSRGLMKDARDILEEQLRRAPHHPLLLERMRELEGAAAENNASSGTRQRPLYDVPEGPFADVSTFEPNDRAFDIAASLDALDALDRDAAPFEHPDHQVDVEEVFAKFKKGVRAQVSEGDSETHYNLGIAYLGMDLHADAISEFEVAARDPARECVCYSMIGSIHRSMGRVNEAIEALKKGLHAQNKTPEQENGLYYELGDAYESENNPSEAVYYFKKIHHNNPNYEDARGSVAARLRKLQPFEKRGPTRAQAVNAPDEFDAAFDAMLGSKRK